MSRYHYDDFRLTFAVPATATATRAGRPRRRHWDGRFTLPLPAVPARGGRPVRGPGAAGHGGATLGSRRPHRGRSMPPRSAARWRRRCSPVRSASPTPPPSRPSTDARAAACGSPCRDRDAGAARRSVGVPVPPADVPRRAAAPAAGPPRRGRPDRRPAGDRGRRAHPRCRRQPAATSLRSTWRPSARRVEEAVGGDAARSAASSSTGCSRPRRAACARRCATSATTPSTSSVTATSGTGRRVRRGRAVPRGSRRRPGRPRSTRRCSPTSLDDQVQLQLVVLNSCQGARTTLADPFAGVATTLIQSGVPAVVAMQFEISDEAAIVFAEELYTNLIGARIRSTPPSPRPARRSSSRSTSSSGPRRCCSCATPRSSCSRFAVDAAPLPPPQPMDLLIPSVAPARPPRRGLVATAAGRSTTSPRWPARSDQARVAKNVRSASVRAHAAAAAHASAASAAPTETLEHLGAGRVGVRVALEPTDGDDLLDVGEPGRRVEEVGQGDAPAEGDRRARLDRRAARRRADDGRPVGVLERRGAGVLGGDRRLQHQRPASSWDRPDRAGSKDSTEVGHQPALGAQRRRPSACGRRRPAAPACRRRRAACRPWPRSAGSAPAGRRPRCRRDAGRAAGGPDPGRGRRGRRCAAPARPGGVAHRVGQVDRPADRRHALLDGQVVGQLDAGRRSRRCASWRGSGGRPSSAR